MIKFPLGKGKEKKQIGTACSASQKEKELKLKKHVSLRKTEQKGKNIMNKGTYKIKCVANDKMLNLCASGSVSNGLNVANNSDNGTVEQKWFFDGSKLRSGSNRKYCLDRYTASTYLDNADVWEAKSSEDANQKVVIESVSSFYRIRLASKVNGEYYYLTSKGSGNGSSSGKKASTDGNIFWAVADNSNYQKWNFNEVVPSGDSKTINGIKVPLPEYPDGSYWTTDGKPYEYGKNSSKEFEGSQCAGFARYVYFCIWGSSTYGNSVTERTVKGNSSDFDGIDIGARISCNRVGGAGNHSMVVINKTGTGITVYECNHDDKCGVSVRTITFANFKKEYDKIKDSSYTP